MTYLEEKFYLYLKKTSLLFKEVEIELNNIKDNFEEVKKSNPNITIPILENYSSIARDYSKKFENFSNQKLSELNVSSTKNTINSFTRIYDTSLLLIREKFEESKQMDQELQKYLNEVFNFLDENDNE